jgi:hypothetical protein
MSVPTKGRLDYTVFVQVGTVSISREIPGTYQGKGLSFRRHMLCAHN